MRRRLNDAGKKKKILHFDVLGKSQAGNYFPHSMESLVKTSGLIYIIF